MGDAHPSKARARLEQVSKAHTALGRKTKWAPLGAHFCFLAERGWD